MTLKTQLHERTWSKAHPTQCLPVQMSDGYQLGPSLAVLQTWAVEAR